MARKLVGYCKVTFLQGMAEVYPADGLTRDDQAIPDWLKSPFLGEQKLVTKPQFSDMGLSISDCILGLLSCF